jgi:hypothetical protein
MAFGFGYGVTDHRGERIEVNELARMKILTLSIRLIVVPPPALSRATKWPSPAARFPNVVGLMPVWTRKLSISSRN